jgi:hypothetical protein
MGLGEALVGAARGLEPRAQAGEVEHPFEAAPRLARGHREPPPAAVEVGEHLADAFVERHLALAREEVVAIALGETPAPLLVERGGDMVEGVGEAQADHEARVALARDRDADVAARVLQARRDDAGRIHQRPVPIENHELVAHLRLLPAKA